MIRTAGILYESDSSLSVFNKKEGVAQRVNVLNHSPNILYDVEDAPVSLSWKRGRFAISKQTARILRSMLIRVSEGVVWRGS